jgi:drug/metabolite transporter (DMT)-like permease
MTWVIYAALAIACFAVFNIFNRVVAVNSEDDRSGSFVFNLWGGVIAVCLFLFSGSLATLRTLPSLAPAILILIACSITLYGGYERLQFTANKHIDASTSAVLFRLSTSFAFTFSIIFLHEQITIQKVLGTALILGANIFLSWKNTTLKLDKYFWIAIVCNVLLGIAWTVDKRVSSDVNTALYTMLLWTLTLIIIYLPSIPLKRIKREFVLGSWKSAVMAFLNVFGFFFEVKADSLADGSRVIPLISSYSILVVLLAIWILKERTHIVKKFIAVGIATVGVILLI